MTVKSLYQPEIMNSDDVKAEIFEATTEDYESLKG